MKIIHFCTRVGNFADGLVNVAVDLAITQSRAGHDVVLASLGGDYEPLLNANGVRTVRLDFRARKPWEVLATRRAIKRLVAETGAEVLHSHTIAPAVLAASLGRGTALTVSTVHNEFQRGARLLGASRLVVCVSKAIQDKMERSWLSRGKTTVIVNGVMGSPRRVTAPPKPRLQGRAIVAIGSVTLRKGSDVLLEAFGEVARQRDDAHLYFVGNVDHPELLDRFREEEWFPRVHLEGRAEDPTGYLAAAEVFVQASRQDPYPLAVLEAIQSGIKMVGSDADGIPEALGHGRLGAVFPSEDAEALAARLIDAFDGRGPIPEPTEADLAANSVERMADDYVREYARQLTGRGAV